ncbi:MAG: pilus assembly protein PilM [bacterium]
MLFDWFRRKQKNCLGIDFGSSGVKVVELSRENERIVLTNYAIAQVKGGSRLNIGKLNSSDTAEVLQKIMAQAGISSRQAVISLSVDETFSTIINMPVMREDEIAKTIPFEARKYVPVPIEEVVLDWSVVGEFIEPGPSKNAGDSLGSQGAGQTPAVQDAEVPAGGAVQGGSKTMQILIVAVPQEVIKKIAQIAKIANLKVLAIEQEAFSIIRSLVGKDAGTYLIIDLGKENVDLVIMDKGAIRLTLTFERNEALDLPVEAAKIITLYEKRYNRKVARAILTGGGAMDEDWAGILSSKIGIPADIGNPFARLASDPKLAGALKEIGPFMAVATGGAMREA